MTEKLRLPHYFTKSVSQEIGELYASTAIGNFALALVMLFEPIFLYSVIGLSIEQVFLFTGAIYFFNIFLMPVGGKIASKYGYYHAISLSIPFQIIYWLLLFGSQQNFNLIYFAPLAFSLEKCLFWPAFHSSMARFAGSEQRGREFSVLYAIVNVVSVIGPFIGGIVSESMGVRFAFVLAATVYSCSFLPLFMKKEEFTPKIYEFKLTWELYKNYPKKALGYFGFGEELIVLSIWPIFIYLVVKDFQNAGLLTTIATLISTLFALYLGKVSDKYNKQVLIKIGAFFTLLVWVFRYVVKNFWGAFAFDSLSRTSKDLFFIPLSSLTYERAQENHIMAYAVFFEQALSISKLLAAIAGALIFAATGSFMAIFILAGLFSLFYMLL